MEKENFVSPEMSKEQKLALEEWIYANDVLNDVKHHIQEQDHEFEDVFLERARKRLDEATEKCRGLGLSQADMEAYKQDRQQEMSKLKTQ